MPVPAQNLSAFNKIIGPEMSVASVTALGGVYAQYESNFSREADQHWAATGAEVSIPSASTDYTPNYYDRAEIYYTWYVRTGNETYLNRANAIALDYRKDYVDYNNYEHLRVGHKAYETQIAGLALHYLATGDEASRTAVGKIADTMAAPYYMDNLANNSFAGMENRNQAKVIESLLYAKLINAPSVGVAGGQPGGHNWDNLLHDALNKILSSQSADGAYRWAAWNNADVPYQVGYLNDVLMDYYRQYEADPRIVTAVKNSVDYIWNHTWDANSKSFWYTESDHTPAPDLNNLLASSFGFIYHMTGDATYKTRGEQVFASGVQQANLDGDKQFNQSYTSSHKFVYWANTPVAGAGPTPGPTPSDPAPAPTPTTTKIGTGPDTLVLKISQDAYKGDAQYTVSVDGVQVGGTLTAKALHGQGSDTVEIKGDWSAGNHTVAVTLVNDIYEGTAAADRNLYVDSATYNGTGVSGSKLDIFYGSKSFTLTDTAGSTQPTPAPDPTPTTPTSFTGTSGNDVLKGTTGADILKGLAGNDTYTVNHSGDQVVESASQGTDKVESTVSYSLPANVEHLQLMGNAAIDGFGNGLNNTLTGNDAANTLAGGGGDDTLNGGGGKDILFGGAGRDTYQFSSRSNADGDKVMEFVHGTDKLDFAKIDANTSKAGDQAFIFDGYKAGGQNGHLWAVEDSAANVTHIYGRTGDIQFVADLQGIHLRLTTSDFLL